MLMDRVVIVTGASRGIGRETARRLAEAGARLTVIARNGEALASLARELEGRGGECLPIATDITNPSSASDAVGATVERFGRLDALINNAAAGLYAPLADTDPEAWRRLIETNLTAPFMLMREAIPIMQRQGGGHIVNVASQASLYGMAGLSAYCASKFALVGLSQAAGRELRGSGVLVSYLCPAWVDTTFLDIFPAERTAAVSKASPAEVAEDIVRLLEPHGASPGRVGRRLRRVLRRLPGMRDPLPEHSWSSLWEPGTTP